MIEQIGDAQMNVPEFVDKIETVLLPEEFQGVCQLAKDGKMGWGESASDWGTKDGKG